MLWKTLFGTKSSMEDYLCSKVLLSHHQEEVLVAECKLIIRLFAWELASMSEYSCSLPTGTTPWKMWKHNENAYPNVPGRPAKKAKWWVGQYREPEGDSVPIRWYEVIMRHGPMPTRYVAPDWSNYARYKSDRKKERAAEKERQAVLKRTKEQRALEKKDLAHGLTPLVVNIL